MDTKSYKTPPHTCTAIQQHAGNLSNSSEFISAAKAPQSWNIHDPVRTEKRLAQRRKQSKTPVTPQQRTPRPRGTLVKCHSLIQTEKHTHIHKPISQLHTDETPTARHSVMTHAIIVFPPVVSDNTGNSGVHHHHTAAAGLEESSLKRLMMTNTTAEIDSTLTPQWAPSIH